MIKTQGIYKIKNILDNKVYIGQSIDVEKRVREHFINIKKRITHPLYNAINKYGVDNFEFSFIDLVTDSMKLNEREQYWIDYYKSYLPEFGYNILQFVTTTRGYKHTEETKKKIASIHKGKILSEETKKRIAVASGLRRHSEETKRKMSLVQKGRIISKEHIQKLRESNLGKVGWNKGIPCREETKRKLSEKIKQLHKEGKYKTEITEEQRKIRSDRKKEWWKNTENRKSCSLLIKKSMQNPERSKQIIEKNKKMWADPVYRNKMTKILRDNAYKQKVQKQSLFYDKDITEDNSSNEINNSVINN